MVGFGESRDRLRTARAALEGGQQQVASARDRVARLDAVLAALVRTLRADDVEGQSRKRSLEVERAVAAKALEEARAGLAQAGEQEAAASKDFGAFTDPRSAVGQLDDGVPILLFPVRLETRFKPGSSPSAAASPELWVRVYPDDANIDTFEPTLTDGELTSVRRYWPAVWAAGGVEAALRAAWRNLVASHGSGRAEWVVQQYRPLGTAPTKGSADDVLLVIATESPLAGVELGALATYWRAVWLAEGDAAALAVAQAHLEASVGGAARAQALIAGWRPFNLDALPGSSRRKQDVVCTVVQLTLPPAASVPTKPTAWSRAPVARLLPDRFVFIGESAQEAPVVVLGAPVPASLMTGPDPYAAPADQLRQEAGEVQVPPSLRWMVDFPSAVAVGMGLRVPLTSVQATLGFDRVLVLGLRSSADPASAQAELETLLEHHRLGTSGLTLLPQGTATNNTDDAPSALSRGDDADASFDALFKGGTGFPLESDPLEKRDGQWLAEYLGVSPSTFARARNGAGRDQADARAMNVALWPATLGYWMQTMMQPVFPPEVVDPLRTFFTRYVSGRGAVPALRIGRQPYGILPATAFSRMAWWGKAGRTDWQRILPGLYPVLRRMAGDWALLAQEVSFTGRQGAEPYSTLLDIVGLHPTSAELSTRYAQSVTQLRNHLVFLDASFLFPTLQQAPLRGGAPELLTRLGYTGQALPPLLQKVFKGHQELLAGPLIDDRPLSETDRVRAYTPDGSNYLEWLGDAARTSLDALYQQDGFKDATPPSALLYLMLRHALQLGYHDGSVRAHLEVGLLDAPGAMAARDDAAFLHVHQAPGITSESRYALLYKVAPQVTGSNTVRVADWLTAKLGQVSSTAYLAEQLAALDRLSDASTARLERAFMEHVDLCAYRLDAWMLGLVHVQLEAMRNLTATKAGPRQGVHLGAYAWLEDVRPKVGALTAVELEPGLADIFQRQGDSPLMRDSTNHGFIHAPSLNQAVAAAVLRNGDLSNATPTNRQALAVNLTSERVRTALALLDGVRQGQGLGALLGYQLELGLHDRYGLAEVDAFIFTLRKAFPLGSDRMASTLTAQDVPIEAVEARNVVDGLALVRHVQATGNAGYPFGLPLPSASPDQTAAIDAEVQRLLDSQDAVADLGLAESVYQTVLGNPERAAAACDAFSAGGSLPEPDVARTPQRGVGLTHRVAVHLESGLDATTSPVPGLTMTPRAQAEPALNQWLASLLPDLTQVGCTVAFLDAGSGAEAVRTVTLHDLGLQPLDWVLTVRTDGSQAMTELDDRVLAFARDHFASRPATPTVIRYLEKGTAAYSVFEVLPQLRALRRLVTLSRPLLATDGTLVNVAAKDQDATASVERTRISLPRTALQQTRDVLDALRATLEAALGNLPASRPDILAAVDGWADQLVAGLDLGARFALPQSGWGFVQDFRTEVFQAVLRKAAERVTVWNGKLAEFDALLLADAALPPGTPDATRLPPLREAFWRVSADLTAAVPASATALRAELATRRAAFVARRDALDALQQTSRTRVAPLLADAQALLPLSAFDVTALDFDTEVDRAVRFVKDAVRVCQAVVKQADQRLAASQALLDTHDASADPVVRVQALVRAGNVLLGEEFVVVPEFTLTQAQGTELEQASAYSASGELFRYLTDTVPVDFPVDTWLHGVARVREKLHAFEQVTLLAGAFDRPEPELTALQVPVLAGDRWAALQVPPDFDPAQDRLLYTAHFSTPFAKGRPQCGLLLDEWTEVIPAREATTGLAFHFDRPNNEAPQSFLLVTPPEFRGAWQWADLVDALDETLDLARSRAVEPVHLEGTAYAQLLPATVMASTVNQLTISATLALNNGVLTLSNGG
ncbi:hypothetical protein OV208_00105 [Corallococcus sp. bb12-1]|uniref:hypothetical protein n=1 Tax=Corallococcus sp. bb12-1 TaxID=2996784 RepID=UPI002271E897|nr:hypothetical protein [Corallococcus sp. bb12-1]MCY1039703.1 hypothetical protein [Corallococcus sp. bb12-1]